MQTTFDTDSASARKGGQLKALADLMPYLWPKGRPDLRIRVVAAVGFLFLAKIAVIFVPLLLGRAVDALDAAMEGGLGTIGFAAVPMGIIVMYGVSRIASQSFGELRDALFERVAQHAIRSVAVNTFRHLQNLSLRFHLDRRTGGLSRVIERGSKAIDFILSFSLFNILPTLLEIILVTIILLERYSAMIALVTFGTVAIYIAYTMSITEWRLKYRREMNRSDNEAMSKAVDSLLNFETVKYFGNERWEADRFNTAMVRYGDAAVKDTVSLAVLNVGQSVLMGLGAIGVLIFGARGVAGGGMTTGDFVAVSAFMTQLFLPLNFLGFVYRQIKQSLVDMEKMFELLDVRSEVVDRTDAKALEVGAGAIEFDRVGFSYDPRRAILKDFSLRVAPGSTVAVVGSSGAGKSTLSRLLYRFYDVSSGAIRIDGQDIAAVTQDSLRGAIGIVPQDTVLFNDTIRYNIAYGRPDATDAEIVEAAKLASIHDFIMATPDGFDTVVGERGLKISGGEKQRVAIARTILKNPKILVFDEATSALDSRTEKDIQRSLRDVSRNRTTITIAHRLSTVIHADEIVVLDKGAIVERGRHEELLAMDGHYAAMWRRQQEAEEHQKALEAAGSSTPTPVAPQAAVD
jgi:ABC-type transport system involved in Fe-S cluster assembly fused permease/ATPase subunit